MTGANDRKQDAAASRLLPRAPGASHCRMTTRPCAPAARPRRAVVVLVALVLALTTLPATAPPAHAADGELTITGRGYGHGRGMGQYGALGYAVDHGWGYQQILDHYYGGTRLAGDAGNPVVGVRLTRLDGRDTILTAPALTLNGTGVGSDAVLVRREANGTFTALRGPSCAGPWSTWQGGLGAGLQVATAAPPTSGDNLLQLCEVGRRTGLRGTVVVQASGGTQTTINRLTVDDYLASVVPSESPAGWGSAGGGRGMHALRAQAVAARSYALSGDTSAICDTTTCQVYRGAYGRPDGAGITWYEQVATSQAVGETTGQVRRAANNAIARTEFSSSTGGWTAGGAFPAVEDLGDATASNPNRTWSVSVPFSTLASRLGTGPVADVSVVSRNGLGADGGRVASVQVRQTDGAVRTFTGAQVRSMLGLKSDWFSVSGRSQAQAEKLVTALYADILGRRPDAQGLAHWSSWVLAGRDPADVASGIVMSTERLNTFVDRQYQAALGRTPDPVGRAHWVRHLQAGMNVPELQVQVFASQEGFNVLGKGDLQQWVDGVYRGVLGRSASAGDRAHWAAQVERTDRWAVARTIVMSDEAALRRLSEYYQLMLGRGPDPAGVATYKPMMRGNGDFVLPIQIGRSLEYWNRAQQR